MPVSNALFLVDVFEEFLDGAMQLLVLAGDDYFRIIEDVNVRFELGVFEVIALCGFESDNRHTEYHCGVLHGDPVDT